MANRKLQGEIDRVFKKVDDGVHVFEQIWDKVYSATTTAQKEKYEGDLKKEIKKLQRLRDHIKTWQGDGSIKDKSKLDSYRKLIEEKMEKFKVCEKETKTKAFSKEGLAQDRTDPKQKAKANVGDWVRDAISKLTEQCEEMEAENETLNSGKRKKRNDEHPRVTQNKEHIKRHQHHMEMLERVLRAVDNDAVTPEEAEELKESVDYYIDSNQDPDFYEDDEMYDSLNLDAAPTPVAASAAGTTPTAGSATTPPAATSASTTSSKKSKSSATTANSASNSANTSAQTGPTISNSATNAATTEDDEDRSNHISTSATPSKKGPSSPRSLSKSGKVSSSGKDGKAGSGLSSNRNSSPKNRRGGGGGNGSGSNNGNGHSIISNHTSNGTLNHVIEHGTPLASPRSPRKPSRTSDSNTGTANANAHPPLLSNVVRAAGSKANGRSSGVNVSMANSTPTSKRVAKSSANSIATSSASIANGGQNGLGVTSSFGANAVDGTPTGANVSLPLNLTSSANGMRAPCETGGNSFGLAVGKDTAVTNAETLSNTISPASRQQHAQLQSKSKPSQLQPSIHDLDSDQQAQISLQLAGNQAAGSASTTHPSSPSSSTFDSKSIGTDAASGDNGSVVVAGSASVGDINGSGLTGAKTSGMSQIDKDLVVLEGMLQYMPEARQSPGNMQQQQMQLQQQIQQQQQHYQQHQKNGGLVSVGGVGSGSSSTGLNPSSTTNNNGNSSATTPATPRNPMDVPASFPSVPATVFDSREVFQQFDLDTLFFIFYYQQGTYQQYLAASELKRQGWRFHKKYQTWFQRHDEPKISTDEYETGTFIYFDYANVVVRGQGSGWCRRFKSEFRFDYRFLEDEL